MKRKQITSLLVLALVWLFSCGFDSIGQEVNVGVGSIVDSLTVTHIEKMKVMEEWGSRCMADVTEYVTIRQEANAEAEAVGRLSKGDGADIIERGEEWTLISSGDCQGYVSNEYLAFDEEAKAIAERDCGFVATITADALKIRSEASENSKTLDLIAKGKKIDVISQGDEWITVKYNDKEAYISADYATVAFEVGEAKTMKEIREEEAAAEAARKKAELQKRYDAVKTHGNEVEVLAALIQMEAGSEPYEGQLAVGAVVMNRVRSSRYPNNIADVIFAAGQFPPAHSAKFQSILANGPKASCMQAAQEAINGVSNVGSFTRFKSARSSVSGDSIVIGGHRFY